MCHVVIFIGKSNFLTTFLNICLSQVLVLRVCAFLPGPTVTATTSDIQILMLKDTLFPMVQDPALNSCSFLLD